MAPKPGDHVWMQRNTAGRTAFATPLASSVRRLRGHVPEVLPPGLGRGQSRKPYFEVLIVTPGERSTWNAMREAFRNMRRESDAFVYEPVVVGSFEDASLAAILNYNLQAVVIFDGFG